MENRAGNNKTIATQNFQIFHTEICSKRKCFLGKFCIQKIIDLLREVK